jgi:mRNA interferase RelE/StbE
VKTIVFSPRAADQLDELPPPAREQVMAALDRYAMTGVGDVKKLSGREAYRLRTGRYRVVFDEDEVTVLAIEIRKRDTATYRR